MKTIIDKFFDNEDINKLTDEGFKTSLRTMNARHDKVFAIILAFQYIFGIGIAAFISPYTWDGSDSSIHVHMYTAIFLGGLIAFWPVAMIARSPGRPLNQWLVACSQSLFSILLIHLTGGRIETHFHVFVSLAFLSFYRNFNLIIFSTAITVVDHLLRGMIWPESIYGTLASAPWRALEHGAWVIFEDIVLYFSISYSRSMMRELNRMSAKLNAKYDDIEALVKIKTEDLLQANQTIIEQKESLFQAAKYSALGEMASNIAHEINNPLSIISSISEVTQTRLTKGMIGIRDVQANLIKIDKTVTRISKTIKGLRNFARNGNGEMERASVYTIAVDTLDLCEHRLKLLDIGCSIKCPESVDIYCHPTQISQIMLNLIGNSIDAIENLEEKWILIDVVVVADRVRIRVIDSGLGVPAQHREKLMKLSFTTKDVGKGTGLGLGISKKLTEAHGGTLVYDSESKNTCFVIELPVTPAVTLPKVA